MNNRFNDTFLKACRNEPTKHIPVWFMRQAGRSLPGYRELRKKHGVLELTQIPELAAQVSMEPVERLGVDAAILFADIMLLPMAMGVKLEIVDSVGPVIDHPLNTSHDISTLKPFDPEKIEHLKQTIRILRKELHVPVIGFAGGPFTLASYLIEGRPSRNWHKTKRFMYEEPQAWHNLMAILSGSVVRYLEEQVDAGAQAIQIFDSWVGCLSAADYRTYVFPHVLQMFRELDETKVPRIHFGTDTAALLPDIANLDCEVVGFDWRVDISRAKEIVGEKAIQGNLDPATILAGEDVTLRRAGEIIGSLPSHTGYIFNLGHGVLPESDDAVLKKLVEYVHEQR